MSATVRAATATDYGQVVRLLEAAGLPTAGLQPALPDFVVAEEAGQVVGTVGLEVYGAEALLRSAVVAPDRRGSGLGNELVAGLLDRAGKRGIREVYLLTTTAERWFPRFGFTRVPRDDVAPSVWASEEFRGACPDSAVAMRLVLERA